MGLGIGQCYEKPLRVIFIIPSLMKRICPQIKRFL